MEVCDRAVREEAQARAVGDVWQRCEDRGGRVARRLADLRHHARGGSSPTVKAALEAARNRDWAACLSALLVEWRATQDPALAALTETVGAIAPAEPLPEDGVGNAITARMQQATDADVTAILAAIVRGTRTMPNLHGAAVKLANMRAPDPRIAATLAHFVENPPFKRTDGALYPDVIEALDAI